MIRTTFLVILHILIFLFQFILLQPIDMDIQWGVILGMSYYEFGILVLIVFMLCSFFIRVNGKKGVVIICIFQLVSIIYFLYNIAQIFIFQSINTHSLYYIKAPPIYTYIILLSFYIISIGKFIKQKNITELKK